MLILLVAVPLALLLRKVKLSEFAWERIDTVLGGKFRQRLSAQLRALTPNPNLLFFTCL
jgi:ABC-type taurine transport system ATPase subunit